jgi:hypothetical protein
MSLLHQISSIVAPWASFYSDSKAAESVVTFGHLGGMMTAGGFALAADRATLRASRPGDGAEPARQLAELSGVHPIVVGALGVTAMSGLLMFAADLETLAVSPAFWIKMGLVGLLLFNGWIMQRTEQSLRAGTVAAGTGWRRMRSAAIASLALWFAVVLAGSILPNVT